jgi:hypothetical protein
MGFEITYGRFFHESWVGKILGRLLLLDINFYILKADNISTGTAAQI